MKCPYFVKERNVLSCLVKCRPDDLFPECKGEIERCLVSLTDLEKYKDLQSPYIR